MKNFLLVVLTGVLGFLVGSKYYHYSPLIVTTSKAVALVYPTKGNAVTGIVTFTPEKTGTRIVADLKDLTPGAHGFHIHEFGNCACDNALCAGDHYNPTGQPHANRDSAHRHVGDMGNIEADAQGNAHLDYVDSAITINGPQSIIGRSVIIHAQPDDFTTQPSGNAGSRIGCGVIGIAQNK